MTATLANVHESIGTYLQESVTAVNYTDPDYSVTIEFQHDNMPPIKLANANNYLLVYGVNWGTIRKREIGSNIHHFIGNVFVRIVGKYDRGLINSKIMANIAQHITNRLSHFSNMAGEPLNPDSVYINDFLIPGAQRNSGDNTYVIIVGAVAQFNGLL